VVVVIDVDLDVEVEVGVVILFWVVGSWEVHVAEEMRGGLRVVLVEAERVGRQWVCSDLSTGINVSSRLVGLGGG
jgi:hypothetical protein